MTQESTRVPPVPPYFGSDTEMQLYLLYLSQWLELAVGEHQTNIDYLLTTFMAAADSVKWTNGIYLSGDGDSNGDWRSYDDGTNLHIQRKEAGSWVTKFTFTAA